ncbi:TetR/AcrR family transcriptional regulator [Amycolatopsis sp.]|uniref:TetR/AcrR family transcriptional regulator n=1 Tax=Amycolatopsis sp. TaxID=37632 RepID=UPI002C1496E4|nr:TetR/AcrR family transcriptional regulator [Amycolatopsis sp.]HVV08987.1 TetR/AcrR family transcriptional regulator [Amycolatopsis sp.]
MARLTRAETQERNRAKVLAAARAEFAERGYRESKVDAIAERADLTRGAVYSNFPGKQALYFAVLAEDAERAAAAPHAEPGLTPPEALGALARAWVARLPFPGEPHVGQHLYAEALTGERTRRPFTQLLKLDALLLSLALERLRPLKKPAGGPAPRLVRLAETVLTTLHGASQLADFVEAFDVVSACEQLAALELNDYWAPPQRSPVPQRADEPWPSPVAHDLVTGESVEIGDGVLAVLGLHRLPAVEQAIRAGADVTLALVTDTPAELEPLARLMITDLCRCLRQAVPRSALPSVRVVSAPLGAVSERDNETEVALRIEAGKVVARAEGPGACHSIATGQRVSA